MPISTCSALATALGGCWDLGSCWLQPIGLLTIAGWPCMPWPGMASASALVWDGPLCVARLGLTGRFACIVLFPPAGTHPACPQDPLFLSTVPSASMTRLARSRTASLTSASSVDGSRPQPCAHSDSSEGMGQVNHTMEVSC